MNLTHETALRGVIHALQERVAPAVQEPFAGEAIRLAQLLLRLVANGIDDAAAARIDENRALRTVFGEAAPLMSGEFATRLRAAAASTDPGLKISELDEEGDRLRRLLVALHTAIEQREDEAARAMDIRIWRLMSDIEARRQPRV